MGRPSSPSCWRGKSLMEGASQIPETNDSTLHQLKLPHPSHVEGPVSLRHLGLATYLNPCPSSLTIPRNELIKTTPNTVRGADFLDLPRSGLGTPPGSASPLKPVRHSFWCPGILPNSHPRALIECTMKLMFSCHVIITKHPFFSPWME